MLNEKNKSDIKLLWNNYTNSGSIVQSLKGISYKSQDFDELRLNAISEIKVMVSAYLHGKSDLRVFKSMLDGYNKRNNLWGFAAMKGQMFFNLLVNSSGSDLKRLDEIIKECISTPTDVNHAKQKIIQLEVYIDNILDNIEEKRKAPNKSSVSYFLSYFWQISEPAKYPIIYTSLIKALEEIDLWKEVESNSEEYEYFYNVSFSIKEFLEQTFKLKLTHWDVEHCFWQTQSKVWLSNPSKKLVKDETEKVTAQALKLSVDISSFDMLEYIPPIISDLIEAGSLKGDTRAVKGFSFEKKVSALFRMLDFELQTLGQGKGREPDGVITNRQDNIAFIYDAKVRESGYSVGTDNRAIKEYVNNHYPKLERQGFKKIGFLIISTTFNGNADEVIREITLETPIKRFALVTSEALLSLLAHKLSLGISNAQISDFLLDDGVLTHEDVKVRFADV